jgi:MFS superfamily sulfate permease-like transporter
MAKVTVHHDRLSRSSSILMILLGVFTWLFVNGVAGVIIAMVGLVMFWFYRRQTRSMHASSGAHVSKGA